MRNIWLVSRILLKNTYTPLRKSDRPGYRLWLRYILIGLCCLPAIASLYGEFWMLFELKATGLAIQVSLIATNMFSLLTCILTFPTLFYFSGDTLVLLPLPIKPRAIVTARVLVTMISCLPALALFGLPAAAAWLMSGASLLQVAWLCLVLLGTCLTTLFLLGILTMIFMRFLPFFRNKDLYNLLAGLLAIVLVLSISLTSSMDSSSLSAGEDPAALLMQLQQQGILSIAMTFFFWMEPALKSCLSLQPWWKLLFLMVTAGIGLLFFWMADLLYLPGATSAMASAGKKYREKRSGQSLPYWKAAIQTEGRILFRTPAYLTNCVLATFLLPLVFVLMILVNSQAEEFKELSQLSMAPSLWSASAFVVGAGVTLFFGAMIPIAATAISREGTAGVAFMKHIPISMITQLRLKLVWPVGLTFLASGMLLIVFHTLFVYPWWVDLVYLAGCGLASLLSSLLGLLCDGLHPKLIWENETEAVKNNSNSLMGMILTLGICLLLGLPGIGIVLWIGMEAGICLYAVLLLFLLAVLNGMLYVLVPKWIESHLISLE